MKTVMLNQVVPIDCEGIFLLGKEAKFSKEQEQWYPGEPHSVENFKVYLVSEGSAKNRIDITNHISESDLEKLKEKFIDWCRR